MALNSVIESSRADTNTVCTYWRHNASAEPAFDRHMFNDDWLAEQNYIINIPSAGRGASLFLNIDNIELVLRHYRRGGMVRSLSEQRYVWLGLHCTRAWREFDVLCALEKKALPAPRPYACQVSHHGFTYTASLITHYLPGITLAEQMCSNALPNEHWFAIGQCIRAFHSAGVDHADLNAHNILNNNGRISLIDFDRAVIGFSKNNKHVSKNLHRLKRSLNKIGSSGPAFYNDECWTVLMNGYRASCAA